MKMDLSLGLYPRVSHLLTIPDILRIIPVLHLLGHLSDGPEDSLIPRHRAA